MESSEDDAGAATDASRRASAREKDLGPSAEVDATASASREASGTRTPCESGAMSEDNFDGDSVPSPSTHDNNASTEAILDMIDEIVDGPGAPKRIPLSTENDVPASAASPAAPTPVEPTRDEPIVPAPAPPAPPPPAPPPPAPASPTPTSPAPSMLPVPSEPSLPEQDARRSQPGPVEGVSQPEQHAKTKHSSEESPAVLVSSPTTSAKCESAPEESLPDTPVVSISEISVPVEIAHSSNTEQPRASSSVPETCEQPAESVPSDPLAQNEEPQVADDCPPPNIPSSSVEETVPSFCEISECESNDRTVKQVTSSDNRDNVTVESAESTSGDACVSEGRAIVPELATRSPLRRRLIRPTPYDRRPDTTVSSTVDSRASDTEVTGQISSESVAKDVSSSSDAVPSVHGNVNDEASSNVSEISVCKAETSTNPPKKIKLIRQKITPSTSQSGKSHDQVVTPESERPSTSSATLPDVAAEYCSSDCISTTEAVEPSQVDLSNVPVSEANIEQVNECVNEIPVVSKENIQPSHSSIETKLQQNASESEDVTKKVPPIKLSLNTSNVSESVVNDANELNKEETSEAGPCSVSGPDAAGSPKQIPKLTIKLGSKQPEEIKSPIPKLTIKPIRPPAVEEVKCDKMNSEPIPNIKKINIKPIPKPPEKINDIHRKSSSSEISESECSENDDASASDQASTSDPGAAEVIPKVTIKLGRPGTESEGKFYTEQNAPKLTITGLQHTEQEESDSVSKLKVIVSQSEEKQSDKIPKLTIKTIAKPESQLSPKLAMKPLKPESASKETSIGECDAEFAESSGEVKETMHVPKITIKPVIKTDLESTSKTPKKSALMCDSPDHIPVVTKLNIKPILKPTEDGETSEEKDEKVPIVSKLNIKPILRPKDSEIDPSVEDIPKVTKLNIKPIKNPEEKSSEQKDCDEWNADRDENSIPVVTKLNIKPIIKPKDENIKDSENQSSETGNSSDDNTDIPVVTKLNIKPILKPTDSEDTAKANISTEQSIPIVTKLNIKPLVKPDDTSLPSSPKKEIPVVTKLIIKPVVKPEESVEAKISEDVDNASTKNPPLVMKINMKSVSDTSCNENIKINNIDESKEHDCNNINENIPVVTKINIKPIMKPIDKAIESEIIENDLSNCHSDDTKEIILIQPTDNCVSESNSLDQKVEIPNRKDTEITSVTSGNHTIVKENCLSEASGSLNSYNSNDLEQQPNLEKDNIESSSININRTEHINTKTEPDTEPVATPPTVKQTSLSNCTLLKKLLENKKKDVDNRVKEPEEYEKKLPYHEKSTPSPKSSPSVPNYDEVDKTKSKLSNDIIKGTLSSPDLVKQTSPSASYNIQAQDSRAENENLTKPLEINISEKITTPSSGQDSPRIILKINKTDHGPSAKIITEEVKKPEHGHGSYSPDNTQEIVNDKQKKGILNSRRKETNLSPTVALGKRLRSSRIVQETDKSPTIKRNASKRPPSVDTSPPTSKEPELSVLETKRLKLGHLLSNKGLTVTPVAKIQHASLPTNLPIKVVSESKAAKTVNHSLLNNENCSKNGNSKLHNILSNLQAKQIQGIQLNDINCVEKPQSIIPELDSSTSTGSSDVVVITPIENTHPQVQEMIINENSESHDFNMVGDDLSQDPLEVDHLKAEVSSDSISVPLTPQPKKRGRPRKIPLSEGAKIVTLPTPALEERPQRSLRLTRDRPTILVKPRGRGRGRGVKRATSTPPKEAEPVVETATKFFIKEEKSPEEIDPTSSRVKLPRMTEALDKMPSVCTTPLSSRKRDSCTSTDMKMFPETPELKVVLECTKLDDSFMKSPETPGSEARGRGRGGRGSRGGRGRGSGKTPRGRGRGRGGGRGAMYMKETMGIYGRVCGPATTTVHLFEEETCMMDDNATPAKPSHLLDEDSQSSVKSLTNESSKMKKSKFADLFDSNKVWTAADVKEYMWPPPENPSDEHQVMMIQEQVAMFLGVKSFKRRYPELKRRSVGGEERSYILRKGLVTEALCDLGITAVDASEVLDIMLSDYPHKYEEYRSHQRAKQQATVEEPPVKVERVDRVEMKIEKTAEPKPEPPKVDPEKTRQEAAAAAAAAASEWNTRINSMRRGACADLQSMTVLRRRPPARDPPTHVRPPAGFYPHALLPGQYHHTYRVYTPDQLRYFPLNTAVAAPPAPASASESSSESEPDWGSHSDSSDTDRLPAKRKKLTKVKRSSVAETKEEPRDEELCRACHLREEGNRKYSHERFLVCSNCNGRLHPSCVELPADTIRKVREYAWQCAECKTCGACALPADDDKMLFCDLCDRGFHIYCVGLQRVPSGRWHCVECAKCKSCGARDPSGLPPGAVPGSAAIPGGSGVPGSVAVPGGSGVPGGSPLGSVSTAGAEWHHQTRRGPGGHKLYSHSLCTPCASKSKKGPNRA
ncbi:PHD finger protein enhancer of yellow 3 isoform X2 [Choristoneura fumiferana]|uniref:PHD finger protein enhancer of yellow 3 isoform X2 n=1 Tax=Choristoneura fumiferana TaxID=7141 RepID=UPI003D15CCCD